MKFPHRILFAAAMMLLCTGVAFSQDDGEDAPKTDLVRYEQGPTAAAKVAVTHTCTVTCYQVADLHTVPFYANHLTVQAEYPAVAIAAAVSPTARPQSNKPLRCPLTETCSGTTTTDHSTSCVNDKHRCPLGSC